ncbi:uncharacterized protein BCN122_I2850 [Burkholderia cenocepacia]|nr:uncharacterized protein BCN122_I2850 [Burkholderia cenocepacia]
MSQIVIFKWRRGSKGSRCHQRRHAPIGVQVQHRGIDAGCRTVNVPPSFGASPRSPCHAWPPGFKSR